MKKLNYMMAAIGLFLIGYSCTGCTTVNTTNDDGSVTTDKQVDWESVNYFAKSGTKIATLLVLNEKPQYADEVAAINAAVAAALVGTPTVESVTAVFAVAAPKMDAKDVKVIAAAVVDAFNYFKLKTGKDSLLESSEEAKNLVKAVTEGIAEGIALAQS